MLDMSPPLRSADRPMLNRSALRLWDRPHLWRPLQRKPLDDLERRRFLVLESLLDSRPQSIIGEGAPDHAGDIFRCQRNPPIGALLPALQSQISDWSKCDVRALPP